MRARRVVTGVLSIAILLALPSAAAAVEVSSRELVELGRRASDDSAALERLRSVDEVDGRPVDVRRLVRGADGDEIERRIETLVGDEAAAGGTTNDAVRARADARSILSGSRFRPPPVPRPFRGVLRWLGDRLQPVRDRIADFFGWIGELLAGAATDLPGGAATLWAALTAVVLTTVAIVARRMIRRQSVTEDGGRALRPARELSPRELERRADEAERGGDLERAIRLRFRAGVLRLDAAHLVPFDPSLTTGELRRALRSPTFDRIGASFDRIAYGGRPAHAEDAAEAKSGWKKLLEEKAAV